MSRLRSQCVLKNEFNVFFLFFFLFTHKAIMIHVNKQLHMGRKRQGPTFVSDETKKSKFPSCFDAYVQVFTKTLNWWPLDVIYLLVGYIFLPWYYTAHLENKVYAFLDITNDFYYTKLYKYEQGDHLRCILTYENSLIELPSLNNFEDELWIKHGKIFTCFPEQSTIYIWDMHTIVQDEKMVSVPPSLNSLKNYDPFILKLYDEFTHVSFQSFDCDGSYLYIQSAFGIWLYSLKQKSSEERLKRIVTSVKSNQSYLLAVDYEEPFFYIHLSTHLQVLENIPHEKTMHFLPSLQSSNGHIKTLILKIGI